jgi:hypothetical protein
MGGTAANDDDIATMLGHSRQWLVRHGVCGSTAENAAPESVDTRKSLPGPKRSSLTCEIAA